MANKQIEVVLNPKIGRFLKESRKRINVVYGGAGSGKSYTIAQYLIIDKFLQGRDKRILTVRKTLPALRITAYQLVLDLLAEYGIPYKQNKSEMTLFFKNNQWLFKSLDDPEKIKSYEANYCWIEEATEVTHNDYMQLDLRLRRQTDGINQMFLSFNPISKLNWIYTELIAKDVDLGINHTTYLNNPFLSEAYIKRLTGLVDVDETFHQVYALGEWGVLRNTIYSNYKIVDTFPKTFDEVIYGLDFGYNNESALVEIGIKDEVPYLRELLYRTGLTTPDLIGQLDSLKIDKQAKIYGDSEDPDAIEQVYRAGYNIHPCKKGKGSVKSGIDYCKSRRLFIHQESANLIAELQSYKWREDKNGNVLDEPVKFKDHLCDAFRYALFSHRHKPFQEIIVVDL